MLDLNVLIVTYNTKKITLGCLDSIFKTKNKLKFKVWVLDNGSGDGTALEIESKYPEVNLIRSEKNLGFVGGNNILIKKAYESSKFTLLLNSDTRLLENSLDRLFSSALAKNADIISCELVNPDKSFQPNAGDLPTPYPLFMWLSQLDGVFSKIYLSPSFHQSKRKYYKDGQEVGWVSGSVMMVKKEVFKKIGLLDTNIFAYGEDSEFCWRAKKAGFKTFWTDSTKIIHIGGASSKEHHFAQWIGEFKGLTYLYKKYYGDFAALGLRLLIYFFTFMRTIAFYLAGKPNYSKTYAKILTSL